VRILLAVNNPSAHLFPLPNGWADRGHSVDVLMDSADGRFGHAREHAHAGLRLLTLSRDGAILDAVTGESTRALLRDLVRSADAVIIGGYATRVARRIVRYRHSSDARFVLLAERPMPRSAGTRRWLRDTWTRWFISQVDAVWSMSEAGDRAFSQLGRFPEARIPYPVSVPARPSVFAETTTKRWSVEGPWRTVVLGQLVPWKQPLAALEAVRILCDEGLDITTEFLGNGPLEDKVSDAAQGLPVTLRGHVPAETVYAVLSASNLLLHPASYDGWGMAVAEAASRGVPVVATNGCDAATELAARTSGVRITDGTPSGVARAAHELIDAFRSDPVRRTLELIRAVEEVCGVDSVVERSLDALLSRGVDRG
jgi:glycosyltransferase involved in cell wall biosynthesis